MGGERERWEEGGGREGISRQSLQTRVGSTPMVREE